MDSATGSALSIVVLILVLAGLASLIYQPATSFLQDFPHHLRQIQERLTGLSASLKQAGHTSEQVEQLMGSNQNPATVVTLKGPGVVQVLFSQTPVFSAKMVVVTILAYFSFGTPGSFPPESGQSSPDLPRQTSSR
jgi:predicted PurR-regulated permease PerM